jgi:hypothetical protein
MKTCSCGSGKFRRDLYDAAGIFVSFVCDDCEKDRRARYRPSVFAPNTPYAASGDERDIDTDHDSQAHTPGTQQWAETHGDDLGESPDY